MHRNWLKHIGIFVVAFSLVLNPVFAVPVHALSAPGLVAPNDGQTATAANTPPLGIPEFQWTPVSGATKYRLQISSDIAFTAPLVSVTTTNTSYTPSTATGFSDGVWYWRVRVETPTPVSEYSDIWSFTKQWATDQNFPALLSPYEGETLDFYDPPSFSWEPVTGAAEYKLQIYSSPGGWATLKYTATTLATTHQPASKLANGTYYWRVVPLDAAGTPHEGTPSEERSFTAGYNFVPALLEPEDNATPTFTPTFRWTAVRGAEKYTLQYTTDPSFSVSVTTVTTPNTSYTPTSTIPNDVNYYWRVRAISGNSISEWTIDRTFVKRWYIKPVLLTPVNLYQHVRFPVFSWTPVPGASYYDVDISLVPNFSTIYDSGNTANTFYTPGKYLGAVTTFYWRVTPYDGSGKAGLASNTSSYVSYGTSVAPHPIYPLFYYPPDTYSGFPGVSTNPHEDRTAPLPIFIWHRVFIPPGFANAGDLYAEAYRLEVSIDATFTSVDWTVDTENTTATPTASNPFTPLPDTDYFWRVRPLIGGSLVGEWSQIWKARFDTTAGLDPTTGTSPTLIRPTEGFEFAEATPLLEWFPLEGATSYDVQISSVSNFSTIVDSATVPYPAYAPTQSLAQRSLGDLDFGVYYWRVRKAGTGTWTPRQRFQIAAQSQWRYTRTLGEAANRLQIGTDPPNNPANSYDLTTLQAAQASGHWYFGFHVPDAPTQNVTYALYLDTDHLANSGATYDPRGYTVTTVADFRPEYAIYILQEAGIFTASKAYLYRWHGSGWDTVQVFTNIGGQLHHDQDADYVELELMNTAIGYQETTGSYTVSLFSLPAVSGQPQDSVPSDPAVPGAGPISRFANVTERMNLAMPPNDAGVDPSTYPSILPFFWDYPILAPWSGAYMKAYLDPLYTTLAETFTLTSDTAYYAQTSHSWGADFKGDNTYYWRVQPRYRVGGSLISGVWSQGWRFEREGFVPENLQTSVTFATPTFSWDRVEGADSYDLQVDNDPNFGSLAISRNTTQNSYTDVGTLGDGTYYWRVRVKRYLSSGSIINDWTVPQSFTLALPTPSDLNHAPAGNVPQAPTLCWTPLIVDSPSSGDPVLAAWKYKVQVSKDPVFSLTFDTVTTEQSCWTPIKGYDDGTYYWRVAMMDGLGKLGNYSTAATFTKQYRTTTLVSPTSGTTLANTPTFVWTPVEGAAKYKLEVSKFPTFSPTYETVTTTNTRWTPTKTYDGDATTYYWRVAIVDADTKPGPYVGSTIIILDGFPVSVYIGGSGSPVGQYGLNVGESTRRSYNVNNGPVKITSPMANIIAAERVVYNVSGVGTSFTEMMGLPNSQLDNVYWLPWYNNKDLNTQLRFANVSDTDATVHVRIGGVEMTGSPFVLPPGASTRKSFTGIDKGPVKIVSDQNIIAAERVVYKVNNKDTSFSEMMALPNSQLDKVYWLPWYNNKDLDTQLRFANVSTSTATVRVRIGGVEMSGSPFTLAPGASTRKSFSGIDKGPVKIISDQNIVAAERVVYKVSGVPVSFSEMMALPNSQLDTTYWLPWYNNKDLDTQLRFANVSTSTATVRVYIGGQEMAGSPLTLAPGASTRKSYTGIDKGPVKILSNVKIVAAERVVYNVNGKGTSFSEMMGLPNSLLDTIYWLPWYNNVELDTQLRFGVP